MTGVGVLFEHDVAIIGGGQLEWLLRLLSGERVAVRALVDELVAKSSLPCASSGYPVADSSLRWHPRIFASGPLAELELGPTKPRANGPR